MTRNTAEDAFQAAKKESMRIMSADRIMVRSITCAGNRPQPSSSQWYRQTLRKQT